MEFTRVRDAIAAAIPFLLLLNIGFLGVLGFPILTAIRHKIRYMRYTLSVRRCVYIIAMLGSIIATFQYPFVGSFVATYLHAQLYKTHCHIVTAINADINMETEMAEALG
jgi:hypothetical protein